jgi:hypothetical protein
MNGNSRSRARRHIVCAGLLTFAIGCSPDIEANVAAGSAGGGQHASAASAGGGGSTGNGGSDGEGGHAAGGAAPTCPAAVGSGGAPEGPPMCGDGFRDPTSEECDVALGSSAFCAPNCKVTDYAMVPPPGRSYTQDYQGSSIAIGEGGMAVLFCSSPDQVIQFFGPKGEVLEREVIPTGSALCAASAITALPCGRYAAVWYQVENEKISLRIGIFDPASATPGPVVQVDTEEPYLVDAPDLVWTGSRLQVIWTFFTPAGGDGIRMRSFDENLVPLSEPIAPAGGESGKGPVIVPFDGSWAASWLGPQNRVHVRAGNTHKSFEVPGGLVQGRLRSELAELDTTHLLVVYEALFEADKIHAAIVEVGSNAPPQRIMIPPPASPLPQTEVRDLSVVRAGSHVYVAWHGILGSPGEQERHLFLRELVWDATTQTLDVSQPEVSLPRHPEATPGPREAPRLGGAALGTEGVLAGSWTDGATEKVLLVEYVPLPLMRLP